jgi:hypothetical protein
MAVSCKRGNSYSTKEHTQKSVEHDTRLSDEICYTWLHLITKSVQPGHAVIYRIHELLIYRTQFHCLYCVRITFSTRSEIPRAPTVLTLPICPKAAAPYTLMAPFHRSTLIIVGAARDN